MPGTYHNMSAEHDFNNSHSQGAMVRLLNGKNDIQTTLTLPLRVLVNFQLSHMPKKHPPLCLCLWHGLWNESVLGWGNWDPVFGGVPKVLDGGARIQIQVVWLSRRKLNRWNSFNTAYHGLPSTEQKCLWRIQVPSGSRKQCRDSYVLDKGILLIHFWVYEVYFTYLMYTIGVATICQALSQALYKY